MTPQEFQQLRKTHWRTQAEAAQALGYTRDKTISEYENGRRPIPEGLARIFQGQAYIDYTAD